jgi:hypothetical protein
VHPRPLSSAVAEHMQLTEMVNQRREGRKSVCRT